MNHSKKLKENDVVVFTKHTYCYQQEKIISLTQQGDIGVVCEVLDKIFSNFDYEIDIGEKSFAFYTNEIEKIGVL